MLRGCFRKSHINVNQGQLSELPVSKLLSFRGQISLKKNKIITPKGVPAEIHTLISFPHQETL